MQAIDDNASQGSYPLVVLILVAANVLVFLWEATLSPSALERLLMRFGMIPAVITGAKVAGGVAANLVQIGLTPTLAVPTVGASGAIAAVLGAYAIMFPLARVVAVVPIFWVVELPAAVMLGLWFVIQLFSGVASLSASSAQAQGGVAYWAHVGGFLFGMVASPLFSGRQRAGLLRGGDQPFAS